MSDTMQASKAPAALPEEFSRLLSDHQGRLRAFILTLVYDPQVAGDILQETNEVLCRKADEFEPGTNFKAWAFRVAFLRVKMQRRRAGRERLPFDDALVEKLEAEADRFEDDYEARRRTLLHCLQRLNDAQRRLVVARYLDAKPVSEIAADWGRSANAVSQALFRARRALMDCVNRATADRTADG